MAFNDFSMVLTVVVFVIFFSVRHYKVTAFVSVVINLCYLILNIILQKHNRHVKALWLCRCVQACLMLGRGVWSQKWEGVGV